LISGAQFLCIAQKPGKWENGNHNGVGYDWSSATALQKDSQKFGFIEIKPYLCSVILHCHDYARG